MKLAFVVPLFDFDYIGENKTSQDMWISGNDFFSKLKDYLVDDEYNIVLKRFDKFIDWSELKIDVFSPADYESLHIPMWAFEFECEKEEANNYKQKLNLLLLASRITKFNDLSIKYIICKNVPHISSKYSDYWKYAIAEKYSKTTHADLNKDDLDEIKKSYILLQRFFKVSDRTTHAVNFLFLAYTSHYWMESFLLYMTALETLVSPDKKDKIVAEVTARLVCLINNKEICSKNKFGKIYESRSDIIHGKILVNLDFDKELTKLQQLQKTVLHTFKVLLEKDFMSIYADEDSKEKFYGKLTNNSNIEKQ